MVVPRRGAYLREANGEVGWVDAGTVSFGHPGEPYRVRHPLPVADLCTVFALAPWAARELLGPEARFPCPLAPLGGRAYLLHRLALSAAREGGCRPDAVLAAEAYGVAFLAAALAPLTQGSPGAGPPAARSPAARRQGPEHAMRARAVVAQHYREPLTLATIARLSGCSVFHLSREFARRFGVPIWRYVLRLRLRDALEQILETRDGLSRIGLAAGFTSQSHFGDAFRAEFGCPPGRVRGLAQPALGELRRRARIR